MIFATYIYFYNRGIQEMYFCSHFVIRKKGALDPIQASLGAQMVKNMPAMLETRV